MQLRHAIRDLYTGTITRDSFVRKTTKEWTAIATKLFRKWKLPEAVMVEDISQELMLNALSLLRTPEEIDRDKARGVVKNWPTFDPTRGKTVDEFVIWNAWAETKKWIHTQRQAYQRDDKSVSRFPVPFSRYGREDSYRNNVDEMFGMVLAEEPEQEIMTKLSDLVTEALGNEWFAPAVRALVDNEFDPRIAADVVYDDREVRRTRELYSRDEAKSYVEKVRRHLMAGIMNVAA